MDDILAKLPPTIKDGETDLAWLTIGTMNDGDRKWQACYIGKEGLSLSGFHTFGKTPYEAVKNLEATMHLLQVLNAPAVITSEE